MLRDKIIRGSGNKSIQEWLIHEISEKKKTLKEIVAECKTAEHCKNQTADQVSDQVGRLIVIKSFKDLANKSIQERLIRETSKKKKSYKKLLKNVKRLNIVKFRLWIKSAIMSVDWMSMQWRRRMA